MTEGGGRMTGNGFCFRSFAALRMTKGGGRMTGGGFRRARGHPGDTVFQRVHPVRHLKTECLLDKALVKDRIMRTSHPARKLLAVTRADPAAMPRCRSRPVAGQVPDRDREIIPRAHTFVAVMVYTTPVQQTFIYYMHYGRCKVRSIRR